MRQEFADSGQDVSVTRYDYGTDCTRIRWIVFTWRDSLDAALPEVVWAVRG
jgi:hypothetical protein